jgi:hypothetical protein
MDMAGFKCTLPIYWRGTANGERDGNDQTALSLKGPGSAGKYLRHDRPFPTGQ